MPTLPMTVRLHRLRATALLLAALLLSGCADTRYYWQSVRGHLALMQAARPVDDVLADPQTPPAVRERLALAQRMRGFAVSALALPDSPSYRSYADLQRRAVVWNVVAAPEFSLTAKTWCFPLLGCVGYRGYFSEADARALADELRAEGLEVTVYGVPAYSTLGWMNWAGGDPLLNTFLGYPEGELARLLFHELAHQVLYVRDDTAFNESFATAVERLGGRLWLAQHASDLARAEFEAFDARRRAMRALTLATRERLRALYALPPDLARLAQEKSLAMQQFRADYARLRQSWGGSPGYDSWVAQANNASFAAQAAYDDLVPAFEALFERSGRDWPRFYDAVRRLADLPASERTRILTNTMDRTGTHGG